MKAAGVVLLVLTSLSPAVGSTKENPSMNMKVMNPDSLPSAPGPAEYFTGTVRVTQVLKNEDPSTLSCGCVKFDPGARSAWHTHPRGQLLLITDGAGYVQEWGKPAQKVNKGDVIWTPPGVKHWHGAAPGTSMSHTAIQETVDGKNVNWMEKVSDEQYRSID